MKLKITRFDVKVVITLLLMLLIFVLIIYKDDIIVGIPFRGPINRLRLENGDWSDLNVTYWIVMDTSDKEWDEIECSFVADSKDTQDIQSRFQTQKSSAWSLGKLYPSQFQRKKRQWSFELLTPTLMHVSIATYTDAAWSVTLKNDTFYEKIKDSCKENARKQYPSIEIENIRICTRYSGQKDFPERIIPFGILDQQKSED